MLLGAPSNTQTTSLVRWNSVVDLSVLLLFVGGLALEATTALMRSSDYGSSVLAFVGSLADTVNEVSFAQKAPRMPLPAQTTNAPGPVSRGFSVKDLWVAHTSKRAWAVRGANLDCQNGQIVMVLGDNGAGKSRLLTAIAEALVGPPRRSRTCTIVRGSISLGGTDINRWEGALLNRKVGIVLNDVRTVADQASLLSGMSLGEILDPSDVPGVRSPMNPGGREQKAVNTALQLVGLSSSLLPRLTPKLATIVTANEEELVPSPLRPRSYPLSSGEWSKLLLARTFAQCLYDNGNSLQGTLLLMDDPTAVLSEAEETRLLLALKQSGAATLMVSQRWASGRWADKIVVMKDGTIVESGTHDDLIRLGPQQSIYAAKWHAMMTASAV